MNAMRIKSLKDFIFSPELLNLPFPMPTQSKLGWRIYFNMRMLTCVFLGFTSGLPLFVLVNLVQAWLRTEGVDLKAIGLFTLIPFPYIWKFVWAPLMDRFTPKLPSSTLERFSVRLHKEQARRQYGDRCGRSRSPSRSDGGDPAASSYGEREATQCKPLKNALGRRRGWMLLMQILVCGSIAALGFIPPRQRGGIKPSAAMDPHTKICISSIQPRRRPRAFFSGLHCVASRSPYELAAGSPPSLRDGDLLRPHRSPYCLRACSLCNLTEKRSNVKLGSFGVKRSISGAQTNFQI